MIISQRETTATMVISHLVAVYPDNNSVKKIAAAIGRSRGAVVKNLQTLKAAGKVTDFRYGRVKKWGLDGVQHEQLAKKLTASYIKAVGEVCHDQLQI